MNRSAWLWLAAAVVAGATGVGVALWRAPHTVSVPEAADRAGQAPVQPAPAPGPAMPAPPDLAADDPAPPGVGVAQWASLRRELASQPAELARLRAYFAFSDAVGRLRDGSASADQRRAAALAVDAALDERLERREVSGAEAKVIKVAVLDQLLDDPAARSAALERWQAEQTAAHPPDTAYRVREDDFLRRQAAIVAAWQARPPAQRDPKALQAELDALRRASFASNPAPNGATR